MSYDLLKQKFKDFLWLEETDRGNVHIDISKFKIGKYRKEKDEFIQYVMFILLKIKIIADNTKKFSDFHIYMKGANTKNFSPLFLKQVVKILKPMIEDVELINKVYLYDLNNFMKKTFVIVKPFFHKETIAKFELKN
tara:strand:+ start:4815 stop:5225 length:411 start_codon:yes stop_codon:yes gene_type:complete